MPPRALAEHKPSCSPCLSPALPTAPPPQLLVRSVAAAQRFPDNARVLSTCLYGPGGCRVVGQRCMQRAVLCMPFSVAGLAATSPSSLTTPDDTGTPGGSVGPFGASAGGAAGRLRAQGMEWCVWVIRHAPQHQLKAMAPTLLARLLPATGGEAPEAAAPRGDGVGGDAMVGGWGPPVAMSGWCIAIGILSCLCTVRTPNSR
jgi:hypothetical protein